MVPPKTAGGFRNADHDKIMAMARKEAAVIVDRLITMGKVTIDEQDEFARQALTEAVANMYGTGVLKDRLAAARLVLEYTMQKPAAKSEVTVKNAEDFLKELAKEE